jgi:hypothetical protein
MLISAKKQWEIYNASKQAQCTNIVAEDTWKWWEILGMVCLGYVAMWGISSVISLALLIGWVLS